MRDSCNKMSTAADPIQSDRSCSPRTRGEEPSVLSVVVHNASSVKANLLTGQLAVKLSFVNELTGDLVKKSDRNRAAISYYETSNPGVDYIMPVLTQAASCIMTRSVDRSIYMRLFVYSW